MNPKTGILLLNFGGPWNLAEVKPFLYKLFSDPNVLVGIPTPFRQLLAFVIATSKAKSSIKHYQQIGGGSPQLKWTETQAKQLQQLLPGMLVAIAMRTSNPNTQSAINLLKTWGAEKIICLPLYPQFSTTTTGSSFQEIDRILKKENWKPNVVKIKSWYENSYYIELLKNKIQEKFACFSETPYVLFSAHSLPMKIVERGDSYLQEVEKTVEFVTKNENYSWSLAFQSREGKTPWLEPYTDHEIVRLAGSNIENLLIVPISFVSDHIETLYEIDIQYANVAKQHGIKRYERTAMFNEDFRFTAVLKSILNSY